MAERTRLASVVPAIQSKRMLTARLEICAATKAHLQALIAGAATFAAQFGLEVKDGYLEFPKALDNALVRINAHPEDGVWWAPWLIIHPATHALIGLAGFKGPPDSAGQIEIGYGIATSFRNHGYASEALAALADFAAAQPGVTAVRAHTLAVHCASARVLEKCGFHQVREVFDEDEGRLWRWERPVELAVATTQVSS